MNPSHIHFLTLIGISLSIFLLELGSENKAKSLSHVLAFATVAHSGSTVHGLLIPSLGDLPK